MEKSQGFLISHKMDHRCTTVYKPKPLFVSISITFSSSRVAIPFFRTYQVIGRPRTIGCHFKRFRNHEIDGSDNI
ncbi:hypothetical protein L1987_25216 [Smallanthus sonchifolius]|uniref:Uncharacterized protein n=1 Tax=Smallanthus sonchifolius TaxID=185202 RepID=A0ACB9IP16_9ASTR|nr:hypothetical protein L1987_25216 [Smallanthus sonchifolius]